MRHRVAPYLQFAWWLLVAVLAVAGIACLLIFMFLLASYGGPN